MEYKYRKNQIFGKRLKVPKHIKTSIYRQSLSFEDYIKYGLEDKIPISCLDERNRKIVEKIGVEGAKRFDWDALFWLLNSYGSSVGSYEVKNNVVNQLLANSELSVEKLNASLYELAKLKIDVYSYTPEMKKFFSDMFFDTTQINDKEIRRKMEKFNEGRVSLNEIINDWNLYKDKDLSYCLSRDKDKEVDITQSELKDLMEQYDDIAEFKEVNTLELIKELKSMSNFERDEYAFNIWNDVIEKRLRKAYENSNFGYERVGGVFKNKLFEKYLGNFEKNSRKMVMQEFGTYWDIICKSTCVLDSKKDLDTICDQLIDDYVNKIVAGKKLYYSDSAPEKMKKRYPNMFLGYDVPSEIRDKFYNREITIEDFETNPKLIDIFNNTNIAYGLPFKFSWIIPLCEDENVSESNLKGLKIASEFSKIKDINLREMYKNFILDEGNEIDIEKTNCVADVLSRLSLSNSSEMATFKKELASQILATDEPIQSLNKIENIFIKNNLPTVGKLYSCFEILHPDFAGFDFSMSTISPVLKKKSTMGKKTVVFSDLVKASFGSNNRSVNAYLKNVENGTNLYNGVLSGQFQYSALNEQQKNELTVFSKHLLTLYNNTLKGRKDNIPFEYSENVIENITELSKRLSPDGSLNYNLADRAVSMFCHFAGIDTLEEAKEYINSSVKGADHRNRMAANENMKLECGDFIKGIGGIAYLQQILQNGSVSKEYLGSSASSDSTPLDTDISMIRQNGLIDDQVQNTASNGYGPIYFALKNDDRFLITRTPSGTIDVKNDMSKLEVFYTGVLGEDHYGIRTGFASSDINYIFMKDYNPRVGLEVAMNGFYIPVANTKGEIVFTPDDYDKLREKMSGLSYYGESDYNFSSNLVTEETRYLAEQIEKSNAEVQVKRDKINSILKESLKKNGIEFKTSIDGDLTENIAEVIDTGSTGRGTNRPGDGDFDFIMRLDNKFLQDNNKMNSIRQSLLKDLNNDNLNGTLLNGDFRLKDVAIDDKTKVDIDISFVQKTDKIAYSTEMALQDRLSNIQKSNPEKYKYVVANILLAKQVLKSAEAYKPNRGEVPQGGLGGVGIENWILQNGGSFIDAANSFVSAAEGKSFDDFKKSYQVWDFGENYFSQKNNSYKHDNFVEQNMSAEGYNKMVNALKLYLMNEHVNEEDNEIYEEKQR